MADRPVGTTDLPPRGMWRVGHGHEPLRPSRITYDDATEPSAGNRFDIPEVGMRYFATLLDGCFAETLSRFRPTARMRALVEDEWRRRT